MPTVFQLSGQNGNGDADACISTMLSYSTALGTGFGKYVGDF